MRQRYAVINLSLLHRNRFGYLKWPILLGTFEISVCQTISILGCTGAVIQAFNDLECVGYRSIEAFKCYYGSLLTPIYGIIRENDKICTL